MRKTLTALLLAACALTQFTGCSSPAEAASITDTVAWDLPTQRENGTVLTVSEIAKTTIHIRASSTTTTDINTVDVVPPKTSAVISRIGAGTGTLCYVGTVTDTGGLVSLESPAVCKTIQAPPMAPSGLRIS